jgi:hypothetical protein
MEAKPREGLPEQRNPPPPVLSKNWGTWIKVAPKANENLPTEDGVELARRAFASMDEKLKYDLIRGAELSPAKRMKAFKALVQNMVVDPMFMARLADVSLEKPLEAGNLAVKMMPKEGSLDVVVHAPIIAVPTMAGSIEDWGAEVQRQVQERRSGEMGESGVIRTTDLSWDVEEVPILTAPEHQEEPEEPTEDTE